MKIGKSQLLILKTFFLFSLALILFSLLESPGLALPNLAVEYGQSCFLCHYDPSGGGPRNLYGSQFAARNELPTWNDELEALENFNPQINDWLTLGGDLRVLYTSVEEVPAGGFRIMQGAVHLTAELNPQFTLYFSKDWNLDYQTAGIAHIFSFDGYLKFGKFLPTYGLRPDDHTMYIRDNLFGSPLASDIGMEIGFHPTNFELAVSVLNGSAGSTNENDKFAFTARTAVRYNLNQINLMAGASFYGDDFSADEYEEGSFERLRYGPFYGINFGSITYLGEVDWKKDYTPGTGSNGYLLTKGLVTSQMLYYEVYRGVFLKACYDFEDYNLDLKTGTSTRYTLGMQWFPYGFFEVQLNLRLREYEYLSGARDDKIQFDGQFHLFF